MQGPHHRPSDAKIAHFEVVDRTIFDGLASLSVATESLSFGFEEVLRDRFKDAPKQHPRFTVRLEQKTVREILDVLCKMDSRYVWSEDGETVNVYPRETVADADYLLNRHLNQLEIQDIKSVDGGLLAIARQLPPPTEQIAIAQVGGSLSYSNPWSAQLHNVTVRQAINVLASRLGPRGSWTFSGSRDFRTFSFHKTALAGMESAGTR